MRPAGRRGRPHGLPPAALADGSAAVLHDVRAQARRAGAAAELDSTLRALRTAGARVSKAADTLEALRRDGLYRSRRVIETAQGPSVVLDGREVLLMCSNDYLGLAGHPALREAAAAAALQWGAGSGASALVSGHMALHSELEEELAAFKGAEACVLFGSGFLANTGVVAALAGP